MKYVPYTFSYNSYEPKNCLPLCTQYKYEYDATVTTKYRQSNNIPTTTTIQFEFAREMTTFTNVESYNLQVTRELHQRLFGW